ncbi:hypothetical protein ABK040_013629 [Willaertia magna]
MTEKKTEEKPKLEDEQLLEAINNEDIEGIKSALNSGANANFSKYIEGTWGAYEQYSMIHKVLEWSEDNKELKREAVELLLSRGADVNAKYGESNWKGSGSSGTAFQMALNYGDNDVIGLFLEHGADPNTIERREAHTMRYDGSSSEPVLYKATGRIAKDLVKKLLAKGANPNEFAKNRGQSEYGPISDTKKTALHCACEMFCEEEENKRKEDLLVIIRYLIDYGADVNALGRHVDQVDVDRGFNEDEEYDEEFDNPRSEKFVPRVKNVYKRFIALHLALLLRNEQLTTLLMANGADTSIPFKEDNVEMSSLELAKEEPFISLIKPFSWSPSNHIYLPFELRRGIATLQKCSVRLNWPLNIDTLGIIYTFLCQDYFYCQNLKFIEWRNKEEMNDKNNRFW